MELVGARELIDERQNRSRRAAVRAFEGAFDRTEVRRQEIVESSDLNVRKCGEFRELLQRRLREVEEFLIFQGPFCVLLCRRRWVAVLLSFGARMRGTIRVDLNSDSAI